MDSFAPETVALAAVIAAAAGVVRGITGFGGALVMSPPFALLMGPLLAVPIVLFLESIVGAPMLVATRRQVRWRVVAPLAAATCATLPLGAWVLLTADPVLMRRAIAGVVVVFSLLLLKGWRYAGAQRLSTSLGLGSVAGAMMGATSLGGPPVILYLLAGPDEVATTRANLTYYLAVTTLTGFAILLSTGAVDGRTAAIAIALAPGYYLGIMLGTRLFSRFDEQRFRRFTLILMLTVAVGILVA